MAPPEATLILNALPWGVLLVDRDRRIRYASARAADQLGKEADGLRDAPLDTACRLDPPGALDDAVTAAFAADPQDDAGPDRIVRPANDPRADAMRVLVRATADPDRVAVWLESLGPFDDERRDRVALQRCLRIAAQVRHGINNALMGVFGHADLILMDAHAGEKTRERARAVVEEAQKVRDRLEPLLTLRRDDR